MSRLSGGSAMAMVGLGLLVPSACVVTSEPTYQPPGDCPPYFVLNSGQTQTDVTTLTLKDGSVSLDLSLVLGSCASDKTFGVRSFLDGDAQEIKSFPPDNGSDTRNVDLTVTFRTAGCHAVELLASSNYTNIASNITSTLPRDVAYVRFFVDVQLSSGSSHTLADCRPN